MSSAGQQWSTDSYKAVKEAFVADNLGSSILSINAVSAAGLVCSSPHMQPPS
jgi:hypothetical protein